MGGKAKAKVNLDLIKTIDDNEEIEDLSEESDVEVEVSLYFSVPFELLSKSIPFLSSTSHRNLNKRKRSTLIRNSSLSHRCPSTKRIHGMT